MKKIYLSIILMIFAVNFSFAQWTNNGNNIYYSTGNIGIGTSNPTHLFTVASTTTASTAWYNTTDQTTNYERLVLMQPTISDNGLFNLRHKQEGRALLEDFSLQHHLQTLG